MLKPRPISAALFLLLVVLFVWLTYYVAGHPFIPLDWTISKAVQSIQFKGLDYIMLAISIFGELPYSLISVLLVAAIFLKYGYKREAFFVAQILFSGLVILLVKNLVNRPRPTEFYVRLVEINRFQSYPSGHVLSYVLFFGFLIVLMKRMDHLKTSLRRSLIVISYVLICAIPFSRIYLGAHWFTDTVGGFLLGLICLVPLTHLYVRGKQGPHQNPSEA